jgi:hypothetical protein
MRHHLRSVAALLASLLLAACSVPGAPMPEPLDPIAEEYVRLVLAVGEHDPDYVDAYYGPPAWREEAARAGKPPLPELEARGRALLARLEALAVPDRARRDDGSRWAYLAGQLDALVTHCQRLGGRRFTFDDEAEALYQLRPPQLPRERFAAELAELDRLLPDSGPVGDRYRAYRERFAIPRARLDAVFQAAIAEARARTLPWVTLPVGESFTVEYVTGKPWSGYNWYQGGGRSVIQVNTDLPIYIDRALDLAAHEGYPGHHAYNALLEQHLARDRGWIEFTVYPLFSPQSLVAEGTANLGIAIAFPGEERTRFEREVLFPLAGLDPADAERYGQVQALAKRLAFAANEAARDYLDGRIDRAAAAAMLVQFALMTPAQAEQRTRFFDKYRAYVINYNLGEELAREHIARRAGDDPRARWQAFVDLISSPRLPAALAR